MKTSLLLDKIDEREAIGATQEEVDREVQRIARQQREAVAVTRAKLQKEGAIAKIAGNIRTEKTLTRTTGFMPLGQAWYGPAIRGVRPGNRR